MMKATINFTLFLFCLTSSLSLLAQEQEATTYYNQIDYMYVAPGMHDQYLALEAAWKKIHQANIDAGHYDIWTLSEVMAPNGDAVSHNYITRIGFMGEAQLAKSMTNFSFPENIEDILTKEELALVDRTNEIRKWVKSEIYSVAEYIRAEEDFEPKVTVFNYFDYPEGASTSDHFKTERDYWMPVHQARIDAGEMEAWVLLTKELPYGAAQPYHSATVDIYESMEAFLSRGNPMPHMESIHGADKIDGIMEASDAAATLLLGELRVSLDRTIRKNN